MTDQQIREARALCERATPGPWFVDNQTMDVSSRDGGVDRRRGKWVWIATVSGEIFSSPSPVADRAFIAAARTLLPAALDALEEREAEIARLRKTLAKINEPMPPRRRPTPDGRATP